MVLVQGVSHIKESTLEMDWYVIIRYRVGALGRPDRIIGYLGNERRSMVEIKIDRLTGEVYALTILGAAERKERRSQNLYLSLPIEVGIPVIDLSKIPFQEPLDDGDPAYFQESSCVHCGIVGRSVVVTFEAEVAPTRIIDAGKGFFILSGARIVGFMTKELDQDKVDLFEDWAQKIT